MNWTVLSDNRTQNPSLATEHGLSILLETDLVIYPHIEIELYFEVLETRVAHFRILVGIVKVDALFSKMHPIFNHLLIVASAPKNNALGVRNALFLTPLCFYVFNLSFLDNWWYIIWNIY